MSYADHIVKLIINSVRMGLREQKMLSMHKIVRHKTGLDATGENW